MYRKEGEWIEAERVAAAGGGAAAARRMQLLHAREILKTDSPEAAVQMLLKVIYIIYCYTTNQTTHNMHACMHACTCLFAPLQQQALK